MLDYRLTIQRFAKEFLMMRRPEFIELMIDPLLEIYSIPQGRDNFAYVLRVPQNDQVAIVDAMEPDSLASFFKQRNWILGYIFNTHHHYDHIGANEYFLSQNDSLQIFGGNYDKAHNRIPGQTKALSHKETISWNGLTITALEIPGHTLGHIGYYFDVGDGHFFCGDTVFLGGCGRLFEGTPAQMNHSINSVIGKLGNDVSLYPAHEYSLSNLEFVESIYPEKELTDYKYYLEQKLKSTGTTLPSTIAMEKRFNPFFRVSDSKFLNELKMIGSIQSVETVSAFGKIRSLKDNY